MTKFSKDSIGSNPRRFFSIVMTGVLMASLLSAVIGSNGLAMQNIGIFLGEAFAAKPVASNLAANIDQCTNGGVGTTPQPCKIDNTFSNWVNGNSNGQKSHWKEGQFISYRTTITGLSGDNTQTHTLRIQYDTIHGGKHAVDYLGSFDATETTSTSSSSNANMNDPCGDKFTCTPASPSDSESIDAASLVNCGGSGGTAPQQASGSIKGFVPNGKVLNISNFAYVSQNILAGTGQCSTIADITFTTSANTVVLTWGGHIASEAPSGTAAPISGWGAGNSASFISGSPYHMALGLLDGASTGSQDRALSTSAVVFTPTMTTNIKDANNNIVTSVTINPSTNNVVVHDSATLAGQSSTAGGTVTYTFFSGTNACNPVSPNNVVSTVTVTNGVVPDSATVTITTAGQYSFSATYSGDSKNIGPVVSPCEPLAVNPPPAGTVTIVKNTVPNDLTDFAFTASTGLTPSTFTLDDDQGVNGSDNTWDSSLGFTSVLPGTYTVTETTNSHYRTSVNCADPDNGSTQNTETNIASIDVDSNEQVTCTFTNEKLGTITWTKNDNNGQTLSGATFEVCRTADYNSTTQAFDDLQTPVCVSVADDSDTVIGPGADQNPSGGAFLVIDLTFGRYDVTEITPPGGYAVDTNTRTVEITPGNQDKTISIAFVDNRPIVKITHFGYDNSATGSPTHGVTSGTTTYTLKVKNYGGSNALVDITINVGVQGGTLASGTVSYVSPASPATSNEPANAANCVPGCPVTWTDIALSPNGETTLSLTIQYNDVPDATVVQTSATATYTTDVSGDSLTRTASGSQAGITFTIQND